MEFRALPLTNQFSISLILSFAVGGGEKKQKIGGFEGKNIGREVDYRPKERV
jgi:hypothetical protein